MLKMVLTASLIFLSHLIFNPKLAMLRIEYDKHFSLLVINATQKLIKVYC